MSAGYLTTFASRKNHCEQTGKGLTRIWQQEVLIADRMRFFDESEVRSQVHQGVLSRVDRDLRGFSRHLEEMDPPAPAGWLLRHHQLSAGVRIPDCRRKTKAL